MNSSDSEIERQFQADWNSIAEDFPPFRDYGCTEIVPLERFEPTPVFGDTFPRLATLLAQARAYDVNNAGFWGRVHLHVWTLADGHVCAWMSDPPSPERANEQPLPQLRLLSREVGRVRYFCRVPGSVGSALVGLFDVAEEIDKGSHKLFRSVHRTHRHKPPIDLREWRALAHDGNGDHFIVHKRSGEVLFVGYDTDRREIEAVGCPDGPLYRLPGVFDIGDWVELIAQQHLDALSPEPTP